MSFVRNQEDTWNAPWGLDSRLKLTALACDFFNANKMVANRERIGKESPKGGNPEPLSATDFLKYLEVIGAFQKLPNAMRVAQIVDRMASSGLLLRVGHGGLSIGGLDDHFLYVPTEWDARRGLFRLVPVLGPEYLYWLCAPGHVHITGTNEAGNAVAGTGLVVHPFYILTCRHVVSDMTVDEKQWFQGREYAVNNEFVYAQSELDVAAVRVHGAPLTPLEGAILQVPIVAQTVYTLGYPKLPWPERCCGYHPAGCRDERVCHFFVWRKSIPVFGDLQTRE